MAIGPLQNLIGLETDDLYLVYVAVARADHRHRISAMYGDAGPPPGHAPFRVVSRDCFTQRMQLAAQLHGGQASLLGRLSRQAAAYGVDIPAEIARQRQAA